MGNCGSTPLFNMRFLYAGLISYYFNHTTRAAEICCQIATIWLEMDKIEVAFADCRDKFDI